MATTLTELSTVISRLHAMGQRHPGQHPLHERLAPAVSGFEALIHLLLVTADGAPADETPRAVEQPSRLAPAPPHVASDFLMWLSGSCADRLGFAEPDDPESEILRSLVVVSSSKRRLPRASAAALGLPATACVGEAVSALFLSVTGPADHGPGSFAPSVRLPRRHDGRLAPRCGT
jgi:hypothetical protein